VNATELPDRGQPRSTDKWDDADGAMTIATASFSRRFSDCSTCSLQQCVAFSRWIHHRGGDRDPGELPHANASNAEARPTLFRVPKDTTAAPTAAGNSSGRTTVSSDRGANPDIRPSTNNVNAGFFVCDQSRCTGYDSVPEHPEVGSVLSPWTHVRRGDDLGSLEVPIRSRQPLEGSARPVATISGREKPDQSHQQLWGLFRLPGYGASHPGLQGM
jgi:hypothetical protein